jgi:hypothetical protein
MVMLMSYCSYNVIVYPLGSDEGFDWLLSLRNSIVGFNLFNVSAPTIFLIFKIGLMKYLESIKFSFRPGKAKTDVSDKDSYTGYMTFSATSNLLFSTIVPVDLMIWPIVFIPM